MPFSLGLLTNSAYFGLDGFSDSGNRRRLARLIALQVKSFAGLPNDDHPSVAFSAGVRVKRHSNTPFPTNSYVKKCVKSECGELVKTMMRTVAVEIEARNRNWGGPDGKPAAVKALNYYCQLGRFREPSTPSDDLQTTAHRQLASRAVDCCRTTTWNWLRKLNGRQRDVALLTGFGTNRLDVGQALRQRPRAIDCFLQGGSDKLCRPVAMRGGDMARFCDCSQSQISKRQARLNKDWLGAVARQLMDIGIWEELFLPQRAR